MLQVIVDIWIINRGIPQGRRNRFLHRPLLKGVDCYKLQIVLIFFGEVDPFLWIPQRMLVSGDEWWEIRLRISVLKRIALDYSYCFIEDGIWTKYVAENVLHQLHFPSWERQLPDVDFWREKWKMWLELITHRVTVAFCWYRDELTRFKTHRGWQRRIEREIFSLGVMFKRRKEISTGFLKEKLFI